MEEINIKDLLSYYKSKMLIIILVLMISVCVGLSYKVFLEKPKYESTTSLNYIGKKTFCINILGDEKVKNDFINDIKKII